MILSRLLFGCFLLISSPVWALTSEELFVAARDAYKANKELALADYTQQLQAQNYLLAPYADYWLMLLRLSQADNQTVRDFLTRYADYPFADRMRGEWLKALGKRQDWATFFDEFPNYQRDDAAVTCYELDGRAQQGDTDALSGGKAMWLVSAEQPANCNPLYDRMQAAGVLTEDDIWARFRLALRDGKPSVAKAAVQRLPKFDSASLKVLDRVYENPQRALEKKLVQYKTRYGRELNLYALERVARNQTDLALDWWKQAQSNYEAADRAYFWARLGLSAARRHDPTALSYFEQAKGATLDSEQLAWKARAALRAKDWPVLQEAIADMAPEQQKEAVWRYWNARALKEQKQLPAANAILAPLSREANYYGLLAEEELGDNISAQPVSYKASDTEVRAVAALPAVQRSIELNRLDMRWESRAEWAWATRNFDDKQMIAAAELAIRQEWYDLAIVTAEKTTQTHDFALRYPLPYYESMQRSARENQLPEDWVYGLTRQESRFIPYARSGVGAGGLMQVMPATAKWLAKRLGLTSYHPAMIHEPDTNIQMGTYYMRHVLDLMDGQTVMATAAYNAGPGRPKRWMASQPLEGAIYAETIPIGETRNYVQKVMSNAYYYAYRLGSKLQTLKQRLGVIAGKGGVPGPDDNDNNP